MPKHPVTWSELQSLAAASAPHGATVIRTLADKRDTAGHTVREPRRAPRRTGTRRGAVAYARRVEL